MTCNCGGHVDVLPVPYFKSDEIAVEFNGYCEKCHKEYRLTYGVRDMQENKHG